MTTPRTLRSLLVMLTLAIAVAPAWAQGDPRVEARTHYTAGKQKFDSGDFRGAVGEFTAADQLAPSPMNDYNIALAYERLNEPAKAVQYYRSYLNRQPTATNRAEVEASLSRLDAAAKGDAARVAADEAVKAEEARKAEETRKAEEARRIAEQGGSGQVGIVAGGYTPTGDAELDRVASVDLNQVRGAAPLPAPSNTGATAAGGSPAAPAGDQQPKKSKPIYKNPVFWVVVVVGVYALIVLSNDDSSQSGDGLRALPDGPNALPSGNSGGLMMRF